MMTSHLARTSSVASSGTRSLPNLELRQHPTVCLRIQTAGLRTVEVDCWIARLLGERLPEAVAARSDRHPGLVLVTLTWFATTSGASTTESPQPGTRATLGRPEYSNRARPGCGRSAGPADRSSTPWADPKPHTSGPSGHQSRPAAPAR